MEGVIAAVGSSKGGAGKTALCQVLLPNLLARGWRVAVVDADQNGTFSRWWKAAGKENAFPMVETRLDLGWVVAHDEAVREQSADAYALLGREDEARRLFARLLGLSNDVGLLSEEYDVEALGHHTRALMMSPSPDSKFTTPPSPPAAMFGHLLPNQV